MLELRITNVGETVMKRTSLAIVAALMFAASAAQAADMPVKASPAPPPAWSWTGFYIGGNFGYSSADHQSSDAHLFNAAGVEQMQTSFTQAPSGWLGGFQAGYNWQASSVVFGVEGDWSWTNQKDSGCGIAGMACTNAPSPNGLSTYSENLNWVGTARGRVGWAQDHWLLYVTGGGAWTRVNTNLAINCPFGCGNLGGPTFGAGSFANNKDGWVIGAGAEVMLAANWTAKVEYQHLDFGTVSQTVVGAPVAAFVTLNDKIRDNIIRFGVNYKFGWGAY